MSQIYNLLKVRNSSLKTLKEEDLPLEGFWRFPDAFSEEDISPETIEKELRSIGISPQEIRVYLNKDKITATRSHKNRLSLDQIALSQKLLELGWSASEINEFCGICSGKIPQYKKETTKNKISVEKKQRLEMLKENIYKGYLSGIKQNQLAKKYNISRHTVISYLNQYCKEHPEVREKMDQKKKENIEGRNRTQRKEIIEKLLPYLERNASGKLELKYTIEKTVIDCEITEVTVIKYKKIIEKDQKKYFR